MTDTDVKVRCSVWARDVELSPIGTLGSYNGYLLVEWPLPWPRDIGEVPALSGLGARLGPARIRLQALVPSALGAPQSEHRVVLHMRRSDADEPFAGYSRLETTIGSSLDAAVDRLLSEAHTAGSVLDRNGTDLLVCTHGRRDVCCGSQGTDLALQLAAAGMAEGVRLARTSHTGGHRFAPTFLVLPQGTAWAFADVALVEQVLERSVPFAEVASRYRGCAGLAGPQVQAVEREALSAAGWDLFDRPRQGYLTGETTADGGQVVRFEAGPDRWEAVVGKGRTLPVPDCMMTLAEAKKSETEWSVSDFRAL